MTPNYRDAEQNLYPNEIENWIVQVKYEYLDSFRNVFFIVKPSDELVFIGSIIAIFKCKLK